MLLFHDIVVWFCLAKKQTPTKARKPPCYQTRNVMFKMANLDFETNGQAGDLMNEVVVDNCTCLQIPGRSEWRLSAG
jgi:hypothetical protein